MLTNAKTPTVASGERHNAGAPGPCPEGVGPKGKAPINNTTIAPPAEPVNPRLERAMQIVAAGHLRPGRAGWYVRSQADDATWYYVDGQSCECPDWQNRRPAGGCKHMRAVLMHRVALGELGECQHCGHVGEDVVWRMGYVGGHGYQEYTQCRDTVACWARWNVQHGFTAEGRAGSHA